MKLIPLRTIVADEEREKTLEEFRKIGIKLQPFACGANPLGHDGRKVFTLAMRKSTGYWVKPSNLSSD